jgi:hypothetical protein
VTAKPITNAKISALIDTLTVDLLKEAKKTDDTQLKLQVVDRGMKWFSIKEKLGMGDDDAGSRLDDFGRSVHAPVNSGDDQKPTARRNPGGAGSALPDFSPPSQDQGTEKEEG